MISEKNRKNVEAEVAWATETMRVSRDRSFNNPDLPFIREVMENGASNDRDKQREREREERNAGQCGGGKGGGGDDGMRG